jgi:hypothetical protein
VASCKTGIWIENELRANGQADLSCKQSIQLIARSEIDPHEIGSTMTLRTNLAALIIFLCSATVTRASGRLPLFPTTQTFKSNSACIAALRNFLAEDQKQALAERADAKGNTQEVQLITTGITFINRTRAQYDATLWYHHGRFRAELQQVEVSHSFEHRLRECDSNILRTSGDKGFTLSTWEPARAAGKPLRDSGASH